MRNSAELCRFFSPHPSLFSWIFRLKWQGNGGQGLYIGGRDPVARWGGDMPPFIFFRPWTSLQIWRKKITTKACRPMGGDRGYFWNFSKQTHIFEILIFFKYKIEKRADLCIGGLGDWALGRRKEGPPVKKPEILYIFRKIFSYLPSIVWDSCKPSHSLDLHNPNHLPPSSSPCTAAAAPRSARCARRPARCCRSRALCACCCVGLLPRAAAAAPAACLLPRAATPAAAARVLLLLACCRVLLPLRVTAAHAAAGEKMASSPEKKSVQHFYFSIVNILFFQFQHFVFTVSTF